MTPQFLTSNTLGKVIKFMQCLDLSEAYKVTFRPCSQRTLEQNDKIQALCGDMAEQVDFVPSWNAWYNKERIPEDVEHHSVSKNDWRHILMAGFTKSTCVPGVERGQVICLYPSSTTLSLKRGCDFIDYIYSAGDDYDVEWTEEV